LHPCFLWFHTFSTLYSSFSLIISSGGAIFMCCLLNWGFLHRVSKSSLNMLWIAYSSGNFSWNAPWPMFFVTLEDLYLFWSSFLESHFDWIFLASSHILSPGFSSYEFCLFLSNCFFMAFFAISINFFTAS